MDNEVFIYRPLDEQMLYDVIKKLNDGNNGYIDKTIWTKQQADAFNELVKLECERLGYNF